MEIIERTDGIRVSIPPGVSAEGGAAVEAYVAAVPAGREGQATADRRFAERVAADAATVAMAAHDAEVERRVLAGLDVPAASMAAYNDRHPATGAAIARALGDAEPDDRTFDEDGEG